MIAPHKIITDDHDLLAIIRELYSRRPKTRSLEPCELQWTLFALGYLPGLAPEAEIAAAVEVANTDWEPDSA